MRLALHVHYRPFSVTSEESLGDSELPLKNSELSLVLVHSLSAIVLSMFARGYMCFVKL